jgi:hypothetical protein
MSKSLVHQFKVAGVRFYPYESAGLQTGDQVTLVAEPENKYDDKAIKVLKGSIQIGHVPKVDTHLFHPVLADPDLESIISFIDLTGKYPTILVTTIK